MRGTPRQQPQRRLGNWADVKEDSASASLFGSCIVFNRPVRLGGVLERYQRPGRAPRFMQRLPRPLTVLCNLRIGALPQSSCVRPGLPE